MSIGHDIIDEIVKQGMITIEQPTPDSAYVAVWAGNAAEQLEALVYSKIHGLPQGHQ